MIYLTADLHFGHRNIMQYENRPFADVEEMDKILIHNWNKTVTNADTVYVLGDVSFYAKEKTTEIISKLNGKKILVLGNHDWDHSEQYWRDVGFDSAYKLQGILIEDWLWLCHHPPQYTMQIMPWRVAYGHVHGSEMHNTVTRQTVCVCVERWDYTPVSLDVIRKKWLEFDEV
ncbi:metallophosphoesterase [bacterium]|nr:metallophosphoesterase [bacterium]